MTLETITRQDYEDTRAFQSDNNIHSATPEPVELVGNSDMITHRGF